MEESFQNENRINNSDEIYYNGRGENGRRI
jgi:hypothetical protein